ncbi:MAG: hypothetical protein J0I48_10550 [Devosia sp.]|uniref:hypothetical protein n=1 Tax=Devosia sp. 66-22 TaxID=1895753 RepID=UPI000925EBD3|nr:hypothetical protein [Devosia sp. 66-22]MBN9346620.1 hypothetical protein [Devosia sp.]OJX54722.1 MAG: hypothetical protein BGO81_16515 [Devosia sp. 66-22]
MCFNPFGKKNGGGGGGGKDGGKTDTTKTITNIINETNAPPPPPVTATAQSASVAQGDVVREEDQLDAKDLRIKKRGRNSLKIRLDAGNSGGSTGVNVPRA